ncbi:hypothetical protein C5167_019197 [Papaver somniferum]|uniref:Uncharacterized protein n=1 Tax=Papaver somniferum TaxID=3469 RepID=A0A4Y7ISJ7_PAPSO|nr:hypothetical protein C5167_019197 [Papaver somniferum]
MNSNRRRHSFSSQYFRPGRDSFHFPAGYITILKSLKQKREQVNHKLIITGQKVTQTSFSYIPSLENRHEFRVKMYHKPKRYPKIHTADGDGLTTQSTWSSATFPEPHVPIFMNEPKADKFMKLLLPSLRGYCIMSIHFVTAALNFNHADLIKEYAAHFSFSDLQRSSRHIILAILRNGLGKSILQVKDR